MATTKYLVGGLAEVEGTEGGVEIQGRGVGRWVGRYQLRKVVEIVFRAIGKGAQDLEPNIFSSTHNKKKYSF
jgi:hypothetical protein